VSSGQTAEEDQQVKPRELSSVILDDSCCLGVGVQCHNVVNGFGATNSFSRRDPANPTGASRNNRMDECGGCGVPLRSVAGE
jgi:hypothetical protein